MTAFAQLCLMGGLMLAVGSTFGLGPNQHGGFTFMLPAGSTECFYQTAMRNDSMEIEYQNERRLDFSLVGGEIRKPQIAYCHDREHKTAQVIAGSGLDVGFALISPSGYRVVSEFRRSDGIHVVDWTEDGDYRLCFDNSFSKLSEKIVFFEVIVNSLTNTDGGREEWANIAVSESLVDYKMEEIRARLDSVYWHLEKSRQVQAVLRAFEARDRYLLEDNLWRVSFWSCMNLLIMLTVAVSQIYTLRRLFDDTKRVRT